MTEELEESKRRMRDQMLGRYRSVFVLEGIGAAIGAVIGWYLGGGKSHRGFAALATLGGAVTGAVIGLLLRNSALLRTIYRIEKIYDLVLAVMSSLLAIAGIIGFVLWREPVLIVAGIFFGLCSTWLIRKAKKAGSIKTP